jgi:hypothetical protein
MIELPTPETDDFILSQGYSPTGHQWRNFTRKLERERDEAREQNAKLRDLAERAIEEMDSGDPVGTSDAYRAELNQLK